MVFLVGCLPALALPEPSPTLPVFSASPIASLTLFSSPTPTEEPTPAPSPTETGTPLEAEMTSTVAATLVPLPTLLPPTPLSTPVEQPIAGSAAIQFYSPGPLSKVTSPLSFYGYAIPGDKSLATVELYGEDGRLLASELLRLGQGARWAFFSWSFAFEVRGVGELGRLSFSTRDAYGRLTALQSLHLLLLSVGPQSINLPEEPKERCQIETPTTRQVLSQGRVLVRGKMRPYNDLPLVIALVGRDGSILSSQTIRVVPDPRDLYVPFSAELPYSVSSFTDVLLTVQQSDHRIPGLFYLYSRQIYLNP